MLIDTVITIAYKCPYCGSLEFKNISFFKMHFEKEELFFCRCGKPGFSIKTGNSGYVFKVPCIGCGKEHSYNCSKKQILKMGVNVFRCSKTNLQLCFIGRDDLVRNKVDKMEKQLDEIIDTYGFESYFVNNQVMLDTLNKVHDIANMGNLYCECGSNDIELLLFPGHIQLKCRSCGAEVIIKAASNTDLSETQRKLSIFLSARMTGQSGEML